MSLRPTPYAGEDSNNSRFVFTYYVHFFISCFFTLCQLFVYILTTFFVYILSNFCLHFRMSSRRSSSEERDGQNADSYISDNFSTLSVSTSNIPNHFTNRMSQYSPRYVHIFLTIQVFLILPKWFFLVYFSSWGGNTITSSRSNASSLNVANQNNNSLDEPVSMIPCNHEQNVLQDVKSKQSQFFNSLFPSRANRFGFPVYPERSFGIPSQMNVPVSFAGFSPGMYKYNRSRGVKLGGI